MNNPDLISNSCPASAAPCPSKENGKKTTALKLKDTQAGRDERGILIDRVGVKDVQFPIQLKMRDGSLQSTIAKFNLYVELPREERGTHMSRFMELLHQSASVIDSTGLPALCKEMQERLHAPAAHIELECPFFLMKTAPVSGAQSLLDYRLFLSATTGDNRPTDTTMRIVAPAKSLCPCSKEISDYGAHNQRSEISAHVRHDNSLFPEDLVEMAEASASSPIYSLLKRPDERHITQAAYDNPKFVEDIIRDMALKLDADDRVLWYQIGVENYESIHNHQAFAQLERTK